MQNCANNCAIYFKLSRDLVVSLYLNKSSEEKVKYLWFGFICFLWFFIVSKAEGLPEVTVVNLSGSYSIDK